MTRVASALAGAVIAAFAAGSGWAASTSTNLSVTVTVVPPGSLGGTGGPSAEPGRTTSEQPTTAPPAPSRPAAPAEDAASPAK